MIIIVIVYFILILSALIIVHEGGHFLAAKWSGVKVNAFAIGMGPPLFKKKIGETEYSIRALPIGGYVKMEGEDEASDDSRAFNKKPVFKKILIVIAGAVMNLLLGFIIITVLVASSKNLSSIKIAQFDSDALSSQTGLQVDDVFYKIDGQKINISDDIITALVRVNKETVNVEVIRNNQHIKLNSVKFPLVTEGSIKAMTFDFKVYTSPKNVLTVIKQSYFKTLSLTRFVWVSFLDLITGRVGINQVSGPVGMTKAVGEAAKQGADSLFLLIAIITLNLGVVNLLPLPALDGGRLIFLLFEAVRGKPVKPEHEGLVHFVGFVLLMLFMLVVTFNDIVRLFAK